jgi:dienelactone hydrolase
MAGGPVRRILRRLPAAALACALAWAAAAAAVETVSIELDDGTALRAHWFALEGHAAPAPAVVALHGCGGLYRRDDATLDARYAEYSARLARAGFHVLLPDSFGSRGSGPICTQRYRERTITTEVRRADVLAAVRWLAQRAEVDPHRIVLLGWSHGATTALGAVNAATPGAAQVAGAIAFYPGCGTLLKQPFRLQAPLLLLLGASDDWTPPAPCEALAGRIGQTQPDAEIVLRVYADSYHGFDSRQPVRLRTDVPNGAGRAGVHQGGNPRARAAALQEVDQFLTRFSR